MNHQTFSFRKTEEDRKGIQRSGGEEKLGGNKQS